MPEWPDDVIDQWLLPFAKDQKLGWPPPDPLGKHRWYYILATKPLSWWQGVRWELSNVDLQKSNLSARDKKMVVQMSQAYMFGAINAYTSVENGRQRMTSAFSFIVENGRLPRPPIAMKNPDGFQFIDGSHRVAAWMAYRELPEEQRANSGAKQIDPVQPIWIGNHVSGINLNL